MNRRVVSHLSAVTDSRNSGRAPDYRDARCPSRVYHGERGSGECVVTVFDTTSADREGYCHFLSIVESLAVRRVSSCFGWGSGDADSQQLAIALLLDVTKDPETTLRWYERFAETYVRRLGDEWTVPEVDIAFWLYGYENAEPDSGSRRLQT